MNTTNYETRKFWLESTLLNDEDKKRIEESDILFMPVKKILEEDKVNFMSESEELKKFLENNLKDSKITYCKKESETLIFFGMKNADLWLPLINLSVEFVKTVGVDVLSSLVIDYIKFKFPRNYESKVINFNLIIEKKSDGSQTKNVHYNGPIEGFEAYLEKENFE